MDIHSFAGSLIETLVIDESNPHYFMSHAFLVAFEGMRLIRCFGHSQNVIIRRNIETLGEFCFSACKSLVGIAFEPDSRVTIFGECAFSECSALKSICIPAQVERISDSCFRRCSSLAEVIFEEGSKLTRIDRRAFVDCFSLRVFVVPARLSILESGIFNCCDSLSGLIFEIPSTLRNLHLPVDDFVSLCIPDSVEVLTGVLRKCKEHMATLVSYVQLVD
jgi:hypothetical protein